MNTLRTSQVRSLRLLSALLTIILVASACSSQAETTSSGASAVDVEQTETIVEQTGDELDTDPGDAAEEVDESDKEREPEEPDAAAASKTTDVEVFGLASHGGGSQVRINRIESVPGKTTTVHGTFLYGRSWQDRLDVDFTNESTTALIDDTGARYGLIEGWELDELYRGDSTTFSLVFESPSETAQFLGLELDDKPNDEQDQGELSPGFVIPATMDFRNGDQQPALPAGLAIEDVRVHPSEVDFVVEGVGFSETNIAVGFVFTNGGTFVSWFDDNTPSTFLEDDLGNVYRIQPPATSDGDAEIFSIREGEFLSGVMVFGGRIHPDATSLTFTMNAEGESNFDADRPRFDFGPWPLDGSFEAPTRFASLTPEANNVHPNGVDLTIRRIDFEANRSVVDLIAINNGDGGAHLNKAGAPVYLIDDLGNRYEIEELTPADRDALSPDEGKGIEGRFTFAGRIDPQATELTIRFNDDSDPDAFSTDTIWPEFTFGPFALERDTTATVEVSVPTDFGQYSVVNFGEVAISESGEVQILISEFDGILIPGGVQLTLPEGILFDVAKAELRPEAGETIEKLLEILDFYEGDPVTILGHTDSDGSDDYNLDLSQRRATSVVDALAAGGVPSSLLDTDARGETQPVADNGTAEGRQENRRVEVQIMTDKGLPG